VLAGDLPALARAVEGGNCEIVVAARDARQRAPATRDTAQNDTARSSMCAPRPRAVTAGAPPRKRSQVRDQRRAGRANAIRK
jgi:hypothetical protein